MSVRRFGPSCLDDGCVSSVYVSEAIVVDVLLEVRVWPLLLRALACARESVLSASLTCDRYSFQCHVG